MNPFKLTITLRQHTPLLHFQHDQAGATLRATEVKPKLDRFLIDDFYRLNPDLYKQLTVGFETELALIRDSIPVRGANPKPAEPSAYSLSVRAEPAETQSFYFFSLRAKDIHQSYQANTIPLSPFFAHNEPIKKGSITDPQTGEILKKGLWYGKLQLAIFSVNTRLIELITKFLPYFLVYQNFGTRQSKGFGVFLPDDMTKTGFEKIAKTLFKATYHFEVRQAQNVTGKTKMIAIFEAIQKKYTLLKRGDPAQKQDSEVAKYFQKKHDTEWEKPSLISFKDAPHPTDLTQDPRKRYVRAVLGLAEEVSFSIKGKKDPIKLKIRHEQAGEDKLDRYRSPILFKVFDTTIYLIAPSEVFPQQLANQTFSFTIGTFPSLTLKTPDRFDLPDFLDKHHTNWQKLI